MPAQRGDGEDARDPGEHEDDADQHHHRNDMAQQAGQGPGGHAGAQRGMGPQGDERDQRGHRERNEQHFLAVDQVVGGGEAEHRGVDPELVEQPVGVVPAEEIQQGGQQTRRRDDGAEELGERPQPRGLRGLEVLLLFAALALALVLLLFLVLLLLLAPSVILLPALSGVRLGHDGGATGCCSSTPGCRSSGAS
nr:hypothetical protein GCM10020093_022510 [Planobispora longispora]